MYKKRFTKWGFMKSRKRVAGQPSRRPGDELYQSVIIPDISMSPHHRALAAVVTGIHDWASLLSGGGMTQTAIIARRCTPLSALPPAFSRAATEF